MTTVPEIMRSSADTYEERNKLYGDNYKRHGQVMKALFPKGVSLTFVDDHNRFGLFTQIVAKLTRYAENFSDGGHQDSLHDLTVYSAMLQEVDAEARDFRENNTGSDRVEMSGETGPLIIDWDALKRDVSDDNKQEPLVIDPEGFLGQGFPGNEVQEPVELSADPAPSDEDLALLGGEPASENPPAVIPEPPVQK